MSIETKILITLSKIAAFIILGTSFMISAAMLLKDDVAHSAAVFTTGVVVAAGLLGWKQAANAVEKFANNGKEKE